MFASLTPRYFMTQDVNLGMMKLNAATSLFQTPNGCGEQTCREI